MSNIPYSSRQAPRIRGIHSNANNDVIIDNHLHVAGGNMNGNVIGTVSSLSNHSTDSLSQGLTNKYYSDTLVDDRVKTNLGVAGLNNTQTSFTLPQVGTIDVNLHPSSQINGEDIQKSPIVEIEVVVGYPLKVFVLNSKVFRLNGRNQADLNLLEGYTYRFNQSDSSNASSTVDNTIRFWETLHGPEYTSSLLTYGKYSNGTVIPPGNAGAYTQLKITSATPRTLYYYALNPNISKTKNTDSDRTHLAGDQKFTISKGGDVISTTAVVNPKIEVNNPFFSGDVRIDGNVRIDNDLHLTGTASLRNDLNMFDRINMNNKSIDNCSVLRADTSQNFDIRCNSDGYGYCHIGRNITNGGRFRKIFLMTTNVSGSNDSAIYFVVGGHWRSSFNISSDSRIKENQVDYPTIDSMNIVKSIKVKKYFNTELKKEVKGFIAQEVEQVLPEAVESHDLSEAGKPSDFRMLNYRRLQVHAFGAIQHIDKIVQSQQTEINTLKDENALLKSKLNEILSEMGKETI